jgi:hypothetical protein
MAMDDPFLLAYLRYPLKMLSSNIKRIYDERISNNGPLS